MQTAGLAAGAGVGGRHPYRPVHTGHPVGEVPEPDTLAPGSLFLWLTVPGSDGRGVVAPPVSGWPAGPWWAGTPA